MLKVITYNTLENYFVLLEIPTNNYIVSSTCCMDLVILKGCSSPCLIIYGQTVITVDEVEGERPSVD